MPLVLLVTSSEWAEGEPGAAALDAAFARREIEARWVLWDDPSVDWAVADVLAVRSTWDYAERHEAFLAWAREVEEQALLLNGSDVFAWNLDKMYLAELGTRVATVPTVPAADRAGIAAGIESFGPVVVKSRVGAGGFGVVVADRPDDPRLDGLGAGPWIVQPLVESVHTEGETSVFVLDGRAVSQVDKRPAPGEIRVHEHFGGVSTPVQVREDAAEVSVRAVEAAAGLLGADLLYGRVDLMRYEGRLVVSELELVEPGLYLDVLPANAEPFVDLVERVLRGVRGS